VEVVFCVVTLELGTLVWVVVLLRETSVGGTEHAPTHILPTRIIVEIYTAVVSFLLFTESR
jgi:hypothetical protein